MTIEVLAADERGEEIVQRWAANDLPIPPSWRIGCATVQALERNALVQQLQTLPHMFPDGHYWVLHQGAMNAESRRESLLNLDSDQALAAALISLFGRQHPPAQVVIQALPRQCAAGVLFTRHPLRQDLSHMVVEGVVSGDDVRQRLIFDDEDALVYQGDSGGATLAAAVPATQLLALAAQLRHGFERPQAGEWVHDGQRLWLLQTLPIGSLPEPRDVWVRNSASLLFNQAVSPLWYTLAGRWFKTGFWWWLLERHHWQDLARVEPYRRQHSHLYANSDFFRHLLPGHPGARHRLPPAWRPAGASPAPASSGRRWHQRRLGWQLGRLARAVSAFKPPDADRERGWRALMALDRLGERLARIEGQLAYLDLPDLLLDERQPLPLAALLDDEEQAVLEAVLRDNRAGWQGSSLRPGADPVHAPLSEQPAQAGSLRAPECRRVLAGAAAERADPLAAALSLARRARRVRFALGERLRVLLGRMATTLNGAGLLAHPDDIHFLYFDELWELWMSGTVPASAAGDVLATRKVRYLEDAHAGAPDWKMDRIGFGFGGGGRFSPVLSGRALQPGRVHGPVCRLCSAWGLNRLTPGAVVVVDQVDPAWVPWLAQAGALVIAGKDPLNAAAALARAVGIPAIWGVGDVMHSVVDGQTVTVDGDNGTVKTTDTAAS